MKNKVSIIIVNYNTPDILVECIKSIYEYEKSDSFEIIIIDNCSPDEDSKLIITKLAEKYSGIKKIILNKQSSFAHANNTGFNSSTGEFVIIMNPDIIFTEPVLEKLKADVLNNSDIGAISPILIGTDGKFQRNYFQRYPTLFQFIFFHSIFAKFFYRFPSLMNKYLENQDIDIDKKELCYVEQIPFAFFMTRREIFKNCGMVDEGYFIFFEDVDMSYTIAKKYKLAIDTSKRITHLGGTSFKRDDNWNLYGLFIKSMIYFFEKNYGLYRKLTLKYLAVLNSFIIIAIENIKTIFRTKDNYRIKKHKYFLEIVNKKL